MLKRNYSPDFIDFLQHNSLPDLPARMERLLGDLISGPEKIVDVRVDTKRILVGVILDTCHNATDAAELCLLACAPLPFDDEALKKVLGASKRAATLGPRSNLEIGATKHFAQIANHRAVFQSFGFHAAYTIYDMAAPGLSHATPPLPAGWSWKTVKSAQEIGLLHRTVMEAFAAGPPGVNIPALDVFAAAYQIKGIPDQLLCCGDHIAGFIDIRLNGTIGIITTIGLVPSFRAQGLGETVLAKAMTELAARGATRFVLTVATNNQSALHLYQKHGFVTQSTIEVFSCPLR